VTCHEEQAFISRHNKKNKRPAKSAAAYFGVIN